MDLNLPNSLLLRIYRDLTFCLGGFFAVHQKEISDDIIWGITRSVGGLFRRHCTQLMSGESATEADSYRPHPAVLHLLQELRAVWVESDKE